MNVFDRKAKKLQKERALLHPEYRDSQYLKDEIAYRLCDRLLDIKRKFQKAAYISGDNEHFLHHLPPDTINSLKYCSNSYKILEKLPTAISEVEFVEADEENLPFSEKSLDIVLSCLNLHWVNDLPGSFRKVLASLKPDGCFLGALFSKDTLFELRVSLQLAELDRLGGFAPHISPFVDNVDLGNLLHQAGFNLITLDVDDIIIHYPSIFELFNDLRAMGETNCAWNRPGHLHKSVISAANSIYIERFGKKKVNIGLEDDGYCIPATFRVLFFIAWRPDPSQMKPLPRGSAKYSLKDIDKIDELLRNIDDNKKI